jgi:hypothetical protein
MILLYKSQYTNLDISALKQVWEIQAAIDMVVAASIAVSGIDGSGGNYSNKLYLNDILLVPDRQTTVEAGVGSFVVQSRSVMVAKGDSLKYFSKGVTGDTSVNFSVSLYDLTPLSTSELSDILVAEVIDAIGRHEIVVHPKTTILGPCRQSTRSMPSVKNSV